VLARWLEKIIEDAAFEDETQFLEKLLEAVDAAFVAGEYQRLRHKRESCRLSEQAKTLESLVHIRGTEEVRRLISLLVDTEKDLEALRMREKGILTELRGFLLPAVKGRSKKIVETPIP